LGFPAPKGGAIDGGDFRNRAWKAVLTKMNVPYRNTIHDSLDANLSPLAQGLPVQSGRVNRHDPAVLYKHYLERSKSIETPGLAGDN
jgi:integrase